MDSGARRGEGVNCAHCGGTLTLEDMTKPNCPFCHHVLAHHARAAEHAVLVNKIFEQRIGAQYPGVPPPQIGLQFGAPMSPSFDQFQNRQVDRAIKRAGWITVVAVLVPLVLVIVTIAGAVILLVVLR
jgi:hypothetical protein